MAKKYPYRVITTNHEIKCGPLRWVRRDSGDHEAWDVKLPKDVEATHFCVKNYGEPGYGESFSGWRVVSGGPFTDAGKWSSLEDAIRGATPYLIEYFRKDSAERAAKAKRLADATGNWLKSI